MARTRRKVWLKLGALELSRRVQVMPRAVAKPASTFAAGSRKVGSVVGVSGNANIHGFNPSDEYLRKLQGPRGRVIFDEMRRSDPQIRAVLSAVKLPLRQANYYIEPASDSGKDVEIAEIAEGDFFRGLSHPWDDVLRHALLMFDFGFSILEKVWEVRDGMVRPRNFDPRLPQSVSRWEWDTSKRTLLGPVQQGVNGVDILLPIEKLLVFTTDKEGDNWEGIPLLRGAYKSWYIKEQLEKINAIKHDRWGVGIPTLQTPPNVKEGTAEYDAAVEMLEALHAQERGYVLAPEGYVVGMLSPGSGGGAGTDALPTIKYYDEAIARSMLAMFISLGSTDTGSRALGGEFTDIFRLSIQAYADYICEVFTRFALREYVGMNWDVSEYPVMKVRRIQKLDPEVLAVLRNAGLLTADEGLEATIREEMNLPEKIEDEEEEPQPEEPAPPDEPIAEDEEDLPETDEEENAHRHERGLRFADRELTPEEQLCDLAGIEYRLNADTANVEAQVMVMRDRQIDNVTLQVAGGRKVQDIVVPLKKEMYELLLAEYKRQIKIGRQEIADEAERQTGKRMALAIVPDPSELLRIIEEELQIKVEGAADKLKTMIAGIALDLRKQGITGEALRAQLQEQARTKIAGGTWKDLAAAAVNQGWGDGRKIGMEDISTMIDEVYRSAILDSSVCPVCSGKDQVRHAFDDPEYIAPDPNCEGGPGRCRCINVAIMKAESAVTE